MHVDQASILFGDLHAEIDRLNRIFACKFEMRDRSHTIRSHLDGIFHKLLPVWVALDAFLRKRDDLDIDKIL